MQSKNSDSEIEELIAAIKTLSTDNEMLRADNETLKQRVRELEEKLNTNSRNSSKSPSQDPNRRRKGKKIPSGKKQGAQEGREGSFREMVPPENVTEFKEVFPIECPQCGGHNFNKKPRSTEERQVTELPAIQPEVIQYNIHTCACASCGKSVKADTPTEALSAFGPRLKGFISLVTGDLGVTKRKVVSLLGYLNIKISVGSVCNIHHLAGEILAGPYEDIRQQTLRQSALHADETSWYYKGKRQWLWVVTGRHYACFKIDPSRGAKAFQAIFADEPQVPPLTTDRYSSYNSYEGPRQHCWSHVDRDFEKIFDRGDIDSTLGLRLKEEADQVFLYWRHYQNGLITRRELQTYMGACVVIPIKVLLLLGSRGQGCASKTSGTCTHLLSQFDKLWTYLYYEDVEPTNNLAERDLRPSVIQRKLSYGTQSDAGSAFVERILTLTVTFKKQSTNLFDYLTACFRAHSRDGPVPSPL